jgi:acetyl-CoA carboxylase carboxyltransferase component
MSNVNGTFPELRVLAQRGGSEESLSKQRQKGKGTARDRIAELLDPGSFQEVGMFAYPNDGQAGNGKPHSYGDGVVTGKGTIAGRPVYLFSQDFTVMGGSVGRVHGRKIVHILELAIQNGAPLIGLNDSAGARIQEGVNSLAA